MHLQLAYRTLIFQYPHSPYFSLFFLLCSYVLAELNIGESPTRASLAQMDFHSRFPREEVSYQSNLSFTSVDDWCQFGDLQYLYIYMCVCVGVFSHSWFVRWKSRADNFWYDSLTWIRHVFRFGFGINKFWS